MMMISALATMTAVSSAAAAGDSWSFLVMGDWGGSEEVRRDTYQPALPAGVQLALSFSSFFFYIIIKGAPRLSSRVDWNALR